MPLPLRPTLLALAAASLLAASPALAKSEQFTAELKGSAEVPPNTSQGTGSLSATLDTGTRKLSWSVTYGGLTGPASAAHFHGPAAPGKSAPPLVPVKGDLKSPIKGSANLTAPQVTQLEGGQWYFNIHTAKHPDGEIRGQLKLQP
jgi:hypothetical protein